jgi:hypothetical protein
MADTGVEGRGQGTGNREQGTGNREQGTVGLVVRTNSLLENAFAGCEVEKGLKPKCSIISFLRHD